MNHELQSTAHEPNPEIIAAEKEIARLEPAVDILESTDEYLVVADMPGLKPDAIVVKLERELLTVEGKSEVEGLIPLLFRRDFRVVSGLDPDHIRAEYKQGVLAVHLPKPPTSKPRRISVSAG